MAVPQPVQDQPSQAIVVALPQELRPYARMANRWRAGCAIDVLRDGGETYAAMLEAISGARRSIALETYILAADRTGDRFKAALIARAQAGVAVRILYDGVGSFGLPGAWLDELRACGAQIVEFNPIAPWRARFRLSHRDHRKILVIDDELAFTGGAQNAHAHS